MTLSGGGCRCCILGVCCIMRDWFTGISIHSLCKGAGISISENIPVVGQVTGGPESCG